jgi:DNA-binding SARP family transcriptional activator/tetratricopeptide (TPR) repeat protein
MEFGVLGEIEPVALGHLRQRAVLAVLLLEIGRPVTADQLIDRVWGEHAPQRARESLYAYVSRLRTALDDDLSRQAGGYVLHARPESVDVHHFRRLVADATAEQSAALFEEALGLWRGSPFAGVDTPWFNEQRDRLEAERFQAELDLTDLRLRQGEYGVLLPELRARSRTHPLNERVTGHLMLALHRAGQTGDALEEYSRIRRALLDELAIEPSTRLRQLQQELLTTEPVRGPVPQQLPAATVSFVGRERALKQLSTALADEAQPATIAVSAVGGVGGIGKTALVLHWAHDNLGRFPDGQLFVDLQGFDPSEPPLSADRAMSTVLQALGVERIPSEPQARTGLYRTMLAGKRLLLILDNAKDSTQVTPLLPGTAGGAVIVTSRNRLGGLVTRHGAVPVDLDALEPADARDLLLRQIGADRASAEPKAFEELLAHCAGLPLALAIVVARAAGRPDLPLSALADELADAEARLDAFDAGESDAGLRAVFETSYRALDPEAAVLLALLARAPGSDISTTSAAALAGGNPRPALHRLESASLIQQHTGGRYRMHDLIRLFARAQHVDNQDQALGRLIDLYLHGAIEADQTLRPGRMPLELEPTAPLGLSDSAEALAWFDAEMDNLLAAQRFASETGRFSAVWQLAWALAPYQAKRAQNAAATEVWERALAVVPLIDSVAARALVHRFYGRFQAQVGQYDEAIRQLEIASDYADRSGDDRERASCQQTLAVVYLRQGNPERALHHAIGQVELYQRLGADMQLGAALALVGWIYVNLGRYDEARSVCLSALDAFRRLGDPDGIGDVLDTLGVAALRGGDPTEAVASFEEALGLYRATGNDAHEADTLDRLGDAQLALGRPAEARASWQAAAALFERQNRPESADGTLAKVTDSVDGSAPT